MNGSPRPVRVRNPFGEPNPIDARDFSIGGAGTFASPRALNVTQINALPAGDGNDLTPGTRLHFPSGVYSIATPLLPKSHWEIFGDGIENSILYQTGLGDGIASVGTVNVPTSRWISIHDMAVYASDPTNTGGGITDLGSTYFNLTRVRVQGFRYGLVLDQSELARIRDCIFDTWKYFGIWIVNSANHTIGANAGYSNQIRVEGCQIATTIGASTAACINDEGGGAHSFTWNNLNGSQVGLWACNVKALTCLSNEHEAMVSDVLHCDEKLLSWNGSSFGAGAFVGACGGLLYQANAATPAVSQPIAILALHGGVIEGNYFAQCTNGVFVLNSDKITGLRIGKNRKETLGAAKTAAPFLATTGSSAGRQTMISYEQHNQTYSTATDSDPTNGSATAGPRTVTPATMGAYAPELIADGQTVLVYNTDGTNAERCVVSGSTGTTFNITLTSTKTANFLIFN